MMKFRSETVLIISHFQTFFGFKHGERLPQLFFMHFTMNTFLCWSAYHKNDDRWNCRKLILQKYNVHRITTTQKIRTNLKPRQAYLLLHSYSKAAVELETKFGQITHKTKSTYYNTATPRVHWNKSQNLVKLYTRQSLHTTTQLLQGSSGTRAKIWSNYTQDKVYILQHSYSKAPVEQEPKFGQIIHKTMSTYYNTATPRLQWN